MEESKARDVVSQATCRLQGEMRGCVTLLPSLLLNHPLFQASN